MQTLEELKSAVQMDEKHMQCAKENSNITAKNHAEHIAKLEEMRPELKTAYERIQVLETEE